MAPALSTHILPSQQLRKLVKKGEIKLEYRKARENYIKAVDNGILKVLSKMGISTLRSYHGAQIFECLGISEEVVNKYFNGTASRIGGIGLEEIAREAAIPHKNAFRTHQKTADLFRLPKDLCIPCQMENTMHGILKA
jgi:glutamate synthase (NADPH) large chain